MFNQQKYDLRFEWGIQGIHQLAPISDVIIIVDILSFTTSVEIATSQDAVVFPYQWADKSVYDFAASVEAIVAHRANPAGIGLSPSTLAQLPAQSRVVMPSPNGSTLSLATGQTNTIAGCFRNCKAVAASAQSRGKTIAVIAAGERWADDQSLRPCIEDYLGAGAILQYLNGACSPEATLAIEAFNASAPKLATVLSQSISGEEKNARGKNIDVALASAINVSDTVPILEHGAYVRET